MDAKASFAQVQVILHVLSLTSVAWITCPSLSLLEKITAREFGPKKATQPTRSKLLLSKTATTTMPKQLQKPSQKS